jgi:hypothetical protein
VIFFDEKHWINLTLIRNLHRQAFVNKNRRQRHGSLTGVGAGDLAARGTARAFKP